MGDKKNTGDFGLLVVLLPPCVDWAPEIYATFAQLSAAKRVSLLGSLLGATKLPGLLADWLNAAKSSLRRQLSRD